MLIKLNSVPHVYYVVVVPFCNLFSELKNKIRYHQHLLMHQLVKNFSYLSLKYIFSRLKSICRKQFFLLTEGGNFYDCVDFSFVCLTFIKIKCSKRVGYVPTKLKAVKCLLLSDRFCQDYHWNGRK